MAGNGWCAEGTQYRRTLASRRAFQHRLRMNKRNVATALWFLMGWTVGSGLAIMVGLDPLFGIVVGFPFALVVRWGPGGNIWYQPVATGTVRNVEDVVAALDRKAAAPGTATGKQPTL